MRPSLYGPASLAALQDLNMPMAEIIIRLDLPCGWQAAESKEALPMERPMSLDFMRWKIVTM